MKNFFTAMFLVLTICLLNINSSQAYPNAGPGDWVLILSSTITPSGDPGGCKEAAAALAAQPTYQIEYVTQAQFSTMTQANFETYRCIVFGDPTCDVGTSRITAAETNQTWTAAVNSRGAGRVYIIGTDPVFHYNSNGGDGGKTMIENGMCFALNGPTTQTSAYICLSCYYYNAAPGTNVPLLAGLSTSPFIVEAAPGCFDITHVAASTPGCATLDNNKINNWGCSVHEIFTSWDQLNFQVLAMAVTGSSYTAPDGTVGTPYVLARGAVVISDIVLTQSADTNVVGAPHTLTATVTSGGSPVVGTTVTFTALTAPCIGVIGSAVTNNSGVATITYTCNTTGTQFINASFVTSTGIIQTSNIVKKTWIDTPLPVEMASFTSAVNGNNVTLNWSTATEDNNSGFDVERSLVNGEWTRIANIEGNGNSSTPKNYSYTDRNVTSGKYIYRLKQIDFNGNYRYFNLEGEINVGAPTKFNLSQNYPNPFNPTTKIDFELPKDGNVSISVYDNSGKMVSTLVSGYKTAGFYTTEFNAAGLSSGIYFYKVDFKSGDQSFIKVLKMSLVK